MDYQKVCEEKEKLEGQMNRIGDTGRKKLTEGAVLQQSLEAGAQKTAHAKALGCYFIFSVCTSVTDRAQNPWLTTGRPRETKCVSACE